MRKILFVFAVSAFTATAASSQQVITNGGFETGTFSGWNLSVQAGSQGNLYIDNTTLSPINGFPTAGPRSGTYFAVTDQDGPGSYDLWQSFTLGSAATSATLKFSIADHTYGGTATPNSLDYTTNSNQQARVDLFFGAYSPFSTASLSNFFTGTDETLGDYNYHDFNVDVTSLLNAPGTYTLRFAAVDNQGYRNFAVDNVSLDVEVTPEPASLVLMFTGMVGIVAVARRRSKNA